MQGFIKSRVQARVPPRRRSSTTLIHSESFPIRSVRVADDASHPRSGFEPRKPVDLSRRDGGPKSTRGTDGRLSFWPEASRNPCSG